MLKRLVAHKELHVKLVSCSVSVDESQISVASGEDVKNTETACLTQSITQQDLTSGHQVKCFGFMNTTFMI